MEADKIYIIQPHKPCAGRKVREASQKLDRLANNLGELFRRRISVDDTGEHAMTFDEIVDSYDKFYRESLKELMVTDKYVARYFKLNFNFFVQNYGVDAVDAKTV